MDKILEKYVKGLFLKHGKKIKFKVGQSVSSDNYISGSVNYIYSGEARVIFKDNQKLKTLTKIGSGQIIGAISILKRAASENVRASSDLVTITLSDREFKKFYDDDLKFRTYFDKQKLSFEIVQFFRIYFKFDSDSRLQKLDLFNQLRDKIRYFVIESEEIKDLFSIKNYENFMLHQ